MGKKERANPVQEPGSWDFGNLLDDLDRSEKLFQERMSRIFEKYNHTFEDDIIVNLQNFTYVDANGPVQWDFKSHVKFKPETRQKLKKTLHDYKVKSETSYGEKYSKHSPEEKIKLNKNLQEHKINEKTCYGKKYNKRHSPEEKIKETYGFSNKTFLLDDDSRDILKGYNNTTFLLQKKRFGNICERTFINGLNSEPDFDQTELAHCRRNCSVENMSSVIMLSPVVKEEDSISAQMRTFISRHNEDRSFEDSRLCSRNGYQPNNSSLVHSNVMAQFDLGDNNLASLYPDMVECIRRLWELPLKKRAADNIVQYYKRQILNMHKKILINKSMDANTSCDYKSYNSLECYKHTYGKFKHHFGDNTLKLNSFMTGPVSNLHLSIRKPNKLQICESHSFRTKEQNRQVSDILCDTHRRHVPSLIQNPNDNCKSAPNNFNNKTIILDEIYTWQDRRELNAINFSHKNVMPLSKLEDALPRRRFSTFPVLSNTIKIIDSLTSRINTEATATGSSFISLENVHEFDSSCMKHTKGYENMKHTKRFKMISDATFTLTKDKTPKKYSTPICNVTAKTAILDKAISSQNKANINVSVSPVQDNTKAILKKAGALQERKSSLPSALHSPGKHNVTFLCKEEPEMSIASSSDTNKNQHLNTCNADIKTESQSSKRDVKSVCRRDDRALYVKKIMNYQNRVKIEEMNSVHQELAKSTNFACPLTRRNSFSTFPVAQKDHAFENVCKKEMQSLSCQRSSSSISNVQPSDIVCSLIISPGSLRAKRSATNDLSLNMFKRQKGVNDTFIQSTHSIHHVTNSFSPLQKTRHSHPEQYLNISASSVSRVSLRSSKS